MSSLRMLRSYARATSLQRPHSSATTEWILLEKPTIQLSMQTLICPPALALPEFPLAKPSVEFKETKGKGLPTNEECCFAWFSLF